MQITIYINMYHLRSQFLHSTIVYSLEVEHCIHTVHYPTVYVRICVYIHSRYVYLHMYMDICHPTVCTNLHNYVYVYVHVQSPMHTCVGAACEWLDMSSSRA